jgi:hypothetical protein
MLHQFYYFIYQFLQHWFPAKDFVCPGVQQSTLFYGVTESCTLHQSFKWVLSQWLKLQWLSLSVGLVIQSHLGALLEARTVGQMIRMGFLQWLKGGLYLWGPLKGLHLLCECTQQLHNVTEATVLGNSLVCAWPLVLDIPKWPPVCKHLCSLPLVTECVPSTRCGNWIMGMVWKIWFCFLNLTN